MMGFGPALTQFPTTKSYLGCVAAVYGGHVCFLNYANKVIYPLKIIIEHRILNSKIAC